MYKDLQPYMCTFGSCFKADAMFDKRNEWMNHEFQVHRREWCCNEANYEAYQDKAKFLEHISHVHMGMCTEASLDSVISMSERPSTTIRAPCPFCASEATKDFSVSHFKKHVASHMEALAFFALLRGKDRDGSCSAASGICAEVSYATESGSQNGPCDWNPPESISDGVVNHELEGAFYRIYRYRALPITSSKISVRRKHQAT